MSRQLLDPSIDLPPLGPARRRKVGSCFAPAGRQGVARANGVVKGIVDVYE